MSDIRHIELPEKDRPLRADVSLLGSLVGEVLVDQHGPDLLEQVEAVRKAAILSREGEGAPAADLAEFLDGLDADRQAQIIHAFTTYLRMVNLAEKVHRIRRRRAYQREGSAAQPGSLAAVLGELCSSGAGPAGVASAIESLRLQPVFTAHPTEATRRTIQEKEYDIVLRMVERLNPELTPGEEQLALRRIRAAITSGWQTRLVPHTRPTVADELDNILFFLTDILYRVVPVFYESAREAFGQNCGDCPEGFLEDIILRFGSWVGGDMDGNPNVTADTILETLEQQRAVIVRRYGPEVRRLARYLSQSVHEVPVSDAVLERLRRYREQMPEVARQIPERHGDMPYRCLLNLMSARLQGVLTASEAAYGTAAEFVEDIELIRASLDDNRGRHAGLSGVERLLRRAKTFGFHLATLDVRQDALLHRRVIAELLGCSDWEQRDPRKRAEILAHLLQSDGLPSVSNEGSLSAEAADTLAVFRSISVARQRYGPSSIGLFIISMTQGADDVLTALALAEVANPGQGSASRLEVAPLLETVDDLEAGPGILDQLLELSYYREHLRGLDDRQAVMIGYSDSNKDSGIVASRWALYQAQRRLAAAGEQCGIDIVFFHGRGGTVSRGGGNLVNGILGSPPGTVKGFLRVTEQGEVINQKFGVRFLALRNLELVAGAALVHGLGRSAQPMEAAEREVLAFMADESRRRFRAMVYEDAEFPAFFRSATPIDVIARLNIGSRPASRRSGLGIENLRAIPWVFSWAQVRVGFPGVFGFGTALDAAIGRFGMENLSPSSESARATPRWRGRTPGASSARSGRSSTWRPAASSN
jgi:phosphoenolpyruvate carboxylase